MFEQDTEHYDRWRTSVSRSLTMLAPVAAGPVILQHYCDVVGRVSPDRWMDAYEAGLTPAHASVVVHRSIVGRLN